MQLDCFALIKFHTTLIILVVKNLMSLVCFSAPQCAHCISTVLLLFPRYRGDSYCLASCVASVSWTGPRTALVWGANELFKALLTWHQTFGSTRGDGICCVFLSSGTLCGCFSWCMRLVAEPQVVTRSVHDWLPLSGKWGRSPSLR